MNRRIRFACILLIGLISAGSLSTAAAQPGIVVHVATNSPSALVFADSLLLGPARSGPHMVASGTQIIRLLPGRERDWSVSPLEHLLEASPGDTVHLQMDFPYHHRLESQPFGAEAWLENGATRSLLGTTPMVHVTDLASPGLFALEMEGYAVVRLTPGEDIWNRYNVALRPLTGEMSLAHTLEMPRRRRVWIDYSAAVLGVAAGVMAVHYKFKADRIDDTYRETGDPTLRPRIARLDDYSGAALGVMQVGLGVLAIRFALR